MSVIMTQGYREVGDGPYKWKFPTLFVDLSNATEEELSKWAAVAKADAIMEERMRDSLARSIFTDAD